jgi:hypothetical protein
LSTNTTLLHQSYQRLYIIKLSLYSMQYLVVGGFTSLPQCIQKNPWKSGIISENEINLFNLHLKCFFFIDNYVYGNMVSRQCQGPPSHAHMCEFISRQFIPQIMFNRTLLGTKMIRKHFIWGLMYIVRQNTDLNLRHPSP